MRSLFTILAALILCGAMTAFVLAEDTPEAAATRKVLEMKLKEVKYTEVRLEEVLDDLKDMVKGFKYKLDSKGGVSRNQKVTFAGKDKTVAEILDGLFTKNGLGYYVISGKNDAYNGLLFIKQGKERGYKAGEEPKDK
jgi:hypothetical protein